MPTLVQIAKATRQPLRRVRYVAQKRISVPVWYKQNKIGGAVNYPAFVATRIRSELRRIKRGKRP